MTDPCDLCGSAEFTSYVPEMYALGPVAHDLVRCRSCSLVQVRPLPTPSAIASMYDDEYFDKDYDSCLSEHSYFGSFDRLTARYEALLDAIEAYQAPGDLFEIGCAGGWFLKLAGERGWQARGIEITEAGSRHAREELGLQVERAAFPDPAVSLPKASFDVVYMGHVLEHLRSPSAGLEAAIGLVQPGGLLVVEVPTYVDSFYFRGMKRLLPALRASGLDAQGLLRALKFPQPGERMEPYHLYEFRRKTLTRMLERLGTRVLRTESRVPKPDSVENASDAMHRAISVGFDALDLGALRLGLPGGNIVAFARCPKGPGAT